MLRENIESILTIIEVLIHDPLYRWAITGPQMQARQPGLEPLDDQAQEAAVVVNADAERTILRVKQKLTGTDNGKFAGRLMHSAWWFVLHNHADVSYQPLLLCSGGPGIEREWTGATPSRRGSQPCTVIPHVHWMDTMDVGQVWR